jgi:hypothetical protein
MQYRAGRPQFGCLVRIVNHLLLDELNNARANHQQALALNELSCGRAQARKRAANLT